MREVISEVIRKVISEVIRKVTSASVSASARDDAGYTSKRYVAVSSAATSAASSGLSFVMRIVRCARTAGSQCFAVTVNEAPEFSTLMPLT